MKNQKGITLIALIITIIVMLILVGVSVTVALDGGLFTTAKEATDKTTIALEKEQLLEISLGKIDNSGKVDYDKLNETITEDGKFKLYNEGNLEVTENGDFKLVEKTEETEKRVYEGKSGSVYIVDERGTITEGVKIVGGDVDGDGAITDTDVEYIRLYINSGEIPETAIYLLEAGDVDGNGAFASKDAMLTERFANGLDPSTYKDGINLNKVLLIVPKR